MNNKTNKQTRDSDAMITMTYIGLCNELQYSNFKLGLNSYRQLIAAEKLNQNALYCIYINIENKYSVKVQ